MCQLSTENYAFPVARCVCACHRVQEVCSLPPGVLESCRNSCVEGHTGRRRLRARADQPTHRRTKWTNRHRTSTGRERERPPHASTWFSKRTDRQTHTMFVNSHSSGCHHKCKQTLGICVAGVLRCKKTSLLKLEFCKFRDRRTGLVFKPSQIISCTKHEIHEHRRIRKQTKHVGPTL